MEFEKKREAEETQRALAVTEAKKERRVTKGQDEERAVLVLREG